MTEVSGAAVTAGDITLQRLQHWMILPDIPVAEEFSRTGDRVEVDRARRLLRKRRPLTVIFPGKLPGTCQQDGTKVNVSFVR